MLKDKQELRCSKPLINDADPDIFNYFLCQTCGDYLFSSPYHCTSKHFVYVKNAAKKHSLNVFTVRPVPT